MTAIRPRTSLRSLFAALLIVVSLAIDPSGHAAQSAARAASCSTASLRARVHLNRATVDSAQSNSSGAFAPPSDDLQFGGPFTGLPVYCDVMLTQVDATNNPINIEVWLPSEWNGRFQGVGGGGYSCGINYGDMTTALEAGYATASTDCGRPGSWLDGSFALNADRTLDLPLVTDFASAGIHDMSVDGKGVTSAYFAEDPAYSYFNGCSTGGREGLMEAQRYPDDYNGIVSGAPAINWTRFVPAELWPQLVMKQAHDPLPTCKEQAFTNAAVKACDGLDGVIDDVISDPTACHWNPDELIGLRTACGTITATDAAVMAKIWQGPTVDKREARASESREPNLWYGPELGTDLTNLAGTTAIDGTITGEPFILAVGYLGTWVQHELSWDWRTLTYPRFVQLFNQSVLQFSSTIATDNPDLSAFRSKGGKILIWHGLADSLIFPQGSIAYYRSAQRTNGGAKATDSFARLFLAPGADHCVSANGPAPTDPLAAVVDWVEHGQAPAAIPAALTDPLTHQVTLTRTLCAYPLVSRYDGHGSPDSSRNFHCGPQ